MTLGLAIALAVKQSAVRTQEALAELLQLDQTTVSKMIRGKTAVTVERIAEIEDLCQLGRGWILCTAGYVNDEWLSAGPFGIEASMSDGATAKVIQIAHHGSGKSAAFVAAADKGDPRAPKKRTSRPRPPTPKS